MALVGCDTIGYMPTLKFTMHQSADDRKIVDLSDIKTQNKLNNKTCEHEIDIVKYNYAFTYRKTSLE